MRIWFVERVRARRNSLRCLALRQKSLSRLALRAPLLIISRFVQAAPALATDMERTTSEFITLTWRNSPGSEYILQELRASDFARPIVIYRGLDTGRVMSGYEDGDYYYRVRSFCASVRLKAVA